MRTDRSDTSTVGLLAQIIRLIEDRPFKSQLVRTNPTLTYLRQAALHSKTMPVDLRDAVLNAHHHSQKLLQYMDSDRERRAMVRTSTAVDVIQGGDKGKPNAFSALADLPLEWKGLERFGGCGKQ